MTISYDKILQNLSHILVENKLKLSLCESCTGGLLSKICTDYNGSSSWFHGSLVTYSNDMKEIIGVKNNTLKKFGAVSKETALEMSKSALKFTCSDVCLSITGVAGPEGGTQNKPVGTVHFSYVDKFGYEYHEKCQFDGDRINIRESASKKGMQIIINCVTESKTS